MLQEHLELICAVASFILFTFTYGKRMGKLEVKVDTIWDFLMRRAMSEAVNKGLGNMNSPLVVNKRGKTIFPNKLKEELKEFYRNPRNKKMTDNDLMLSIEKNFGEKILKDVCLPNGLSDGACLLIAKEIIRN